MKIYIAGPFSTERERESLKHMIELVKSRYPGYSLYIPMEYKVPGDFQKLDGTWNLSNDEWARKVYENDIKNLDSADLVIFMYTGHYCSSGTIWEVGYACGKGIITIIYIPEWAQKENMSLMVMNSTKHCLIEDGNIHRFDIDLINYNQK